MLTGSLFPSLSPGMGDSENGSYVGLTKMILKKTLGRSNLYYLETVVTEIQAILNDRPLTHISSDVFNLVLLTLVSLSELVENRCIFNFALHVFGKQSYLLVNIIAIDLAFKSRSG